MVRDRRQSKRESVHIDAVIIDEAGRMPCVVLDETDDGFRLQVESPFDVPADFVLEFTGDGRTCACTRIWQQDNEIGVRRAEKTGE